MQWVVACAVRDREFGGLVAEVYERQSLEPGLTWGIAADIASGLVRGVFDVPMTPLLARYVAAIIAAAIRATLAGEAGAAVLAAQSHLRMLGVPPERSGTIAREAAARLEGLLSGSS